MNATYEYGPFGEFSRANGPMAARNPIRFSSKYRDNESELVYYGHRFYSPSLGRWINRDPSGEDSDNSLYSVVGNHPSNAVDPTGLYEMDFHYYVILFLFRSKGYPASIAERIAQASQGVDDNPLTDPLELGTQGRGKNNEYTKRLRDFHFPGSSKTVGTYTLEETSLNSAATLLNDWRGGNPGDPEQTGAALHTLADTFSHDGFTAYFNLTVNGLDNNKNQWLGHYNGEKAGPFQKYLFRVGHASFGSRPDYPFLRKQRAIDAAKIIFDLIPDYEDSICVYRSSWDTVDYLLETQFGNSGTEGERAEAAYRMIGNRFPNDSGHRYFGVHNMGSANDR